MSAVNLVKGCPLFHEIYDDEVADILRNCFVAHYNPGDYIINQGDTSTDICVLLEGEADVIVDTGDGNQKYITTLGKGDLFGELVLINETKRTANIQAKTRSDVLIIGHDDFYSFYNRKPKVFALLVLNVTRLVTKRLKNANLIIEEMSQENKKAG